MDLNENLEEKERSLGDGMDNILLKLTKKTFSQNNMKVNIRLTSKNQHSFKPIEPNSKIIKLIPKYCPKERKQPKYLIKKSKEPKFVPYEPYKGAIEPILPRKVKMSPKPSKNNVEIQELVTQMSELRASELKKAVKETNDNETISFKEWEKAKAAYETDIKNLRETNAHLENQLKFQAQVNSELKTLLVAAVGEDLESRVQHLTEDKLQLARALLNSANHLTSHQEQTEWLSGQCEVWRSKFLASSLMVEELARWKSALSSRINDLQESIKSLLEERRLVQRKTMKIHCYLRCISEKLANGNESNLVKNSNIVELSNSNYNLIESISNAININKENLDTLYEHCLKLSQFTISETLAIKLLQNPVTISNKQDVICNALMGTAMSLYGEQMYLQNPSSHATCCAHCTGEIKNV